MKRKDGRRERRERTRERLLEAAEEAFMASGYAGTGMKSIAVGSGVTQSLIHYHFGNKEGLWRAVELRIYRRMFEALRLNLSDAVRSGDLVSAFATSYFEYLGKEGNYRDLVGWHRALDTNPPSEIEGKSSPLVRIIGDLQGRKQIRDDIPAVLVHTLMWALTEGWQIGKKQYAFRVGENIDGPEWDSRYLDAALKVLDRGLSPL